MSNNNPEDAVIRYIREALVRGELKPGMRLPAERKLAERFNISRAYVREALRKLETYGIIRTLPQSGSVIVGLDSSALDGLLADILLLDKDDFASLAEMRCILEEAAARLCAVRRTEADMQYIYAALAHYTEVASRTNDDAERQSADFKFHRCIARGAHNNVLHQMIMLISPNIMQIYRRDDPCNVIAVDVVREHLEICMSIAKGNADEAGDLMKKHLSGAAEYAAKLREQQQNSAETK